jgi:pantoate--beta-alanine ligase
METIRTVEWMKQTAREARSSNHIIGLVPTMGALHEGHLSLIRAARSETSVAIVSIFVNPLQFGKNEDLTRYPRTFEEDRAVLESLRVDYLFLPSAEDMYPTGFSTSVNVDGLGECLEGKKRPGHFRGVATVVLKLFEIVQPRFAYFGRKDAQQARILRQMAADLNLDAELVVLPIVRDPSGLALSSRNSYLSTEERQAAPALHRSLLAAERIITHGGERNGHAILERVRQILASEPLIKLDYAELADAESFEPVITLRRRAMLLLAARVGNTRLIDNALIEPVETGFRVTT